MTTPRRTRGYDPRGYAKAVLAALVAASATYTTSILAESRGGEDVVASEWGTMVFVALIAGLGVYVVPNRER